MIAETYPAEYYSWIINGGINGKRKAEVRKKAATDLLKWTDSRNVSANDDLVDATKNGFPEGKDDAFDATIGLCGILEVVLQKRPTGEPRGKWQRAVERWILGQCKDSVQKLV